MCGGFNGELVLSKSVTIKDFAFMGCSGFIGSLDLKSCHSIDHHCFHGCMRFTGSLQISENDSRIDVLVFRDLTDN